MTERDIIARLSRRHTRDLFFAQVKTGPTWGIGGRPLRQIDALAVRKSWANPCFTAYEVKVTRGDFQRDDKWPAYMALSHRFYWACPNGLIAKDEIDPRAGLIWFNKLGGHSVRKAALVRDVEIDPLLVYYLVLYRVDDGAPDPEYTQDIARRWLKGKADNMALGRALGSEMARRLRRAEDDLARERQAHNQWKAALDRHEIYMVSQLDQRLEQSPRPIIPKWSLDDLKRSLAAALKAVTNEQERLAREDEP